MVDGSDHDDEFGPAPHPDDRIWRHPSELRGFATAPVAAPPRWGRWIGTTLAVTAVIGGALVAGAALTGAPEPGPDAEMMSSPPAAVALLATSTSTREQPGWIGLSGVDTPEGVEVVSCDAAGPARAKLRAGDRILEVDRVTIGRMRDLSRYLTRRAAGDTVTIRFERSGVVKTVQIRLAPR